ncbi:MAG: chromosome segregation protein SMC [Nitrospiraceae bacterium]|nr:chromosome segregation protein SMC [Nitrospiraceae bacterium]
MKLKSISIKGFKSFADPVELQLTQGINVVVGPNGSGKSNIVDAISWVLGAQSPKSLRSSKMEEVIFAGNQGRSASRSAIVEIVLDNASGRLGSGGSQVSIARELTRDGQSRYEINGRECRLIDVQELLADAGIGRGQHTIVSQGSLESVLDAKPEERRLVIEEAAGIAKYRRRQERTRRRMEVVDAEFERASEASRELKKRIRPLERQADAAKRHLDLKDEISQLKGYLLGEEYRRHLDDSLGEQDRLSALANRLAEIEPLLGSMRARRDELGDAGGEEEGIADSERLRRAGELRGRFTRVALLAGERARRLEERLAQLGDDSRERALGEQLAALRAEKERLEAEVIGIGPALEQLEEEERQLDASGLQASAAMVRELEEKERTLAEAARQASNSRARALQASESASKAARSAEARLSRLGDQLSQGRASLEQLRTRYENFAGELEGAGSGLEDGRLELSAAVATEAELAERLAAAQAEHAAATAVLQALERAAASMRAGSHLELARQIAEPLGVLIELLDIEPGFEKAVEAALAPWGRAVVQRDMEAARASFLAIRGASARALVLGASPGGFPAPETLPAPTGTKPVADLVKSAHPAVADLVGWLLGGAFLVAEGEQALGSVAEPRVRMVTASGERASLIGFEAVSETEVVTRRTQTEAAERAKVATESLGVVSSEHAAARAARSALESSVKEREANAERARREAATALAALERQSASVEGLVLQIQEATENLGRLSADEAEAAARLEPTETELAALESALKQVRQGLDGTRREAARIAEAMAAAKARRSAIEVRAARLWERLKQLDEQIAAMEAELAAEIGRREKSLSEAEVVRARLARHLALARRCNTGEGELLALEADLRTSIEERQMRRSALKEESARLAAEIDRLSYQRHLLDQDVASAKLRLRESEVRSQVMQERIWRELEIDPEVARQIPILPGVEPSAAPEHLRRLEEELARMGPINQLAQIELAELREQQRFLDSQLEDVAASRNELRSLDREITREMRSVFLSALQDVSAHFEETFGLLFPGGRGELRLMDESDPLSSGLDFVLSIPGKSVRSINLLSGGERSLVALGFLIAVFSSRPSPFYILDEVEAALDDLSLSRLLALLEAFGAHAQLFVISHQKRTMEIAHNLFGVAMNGDGATRVVVDRLADRQLRIYGTS